MLSAEEPAVTAGLLLLSYPLHPPGKPERLRTDHWSKITVPALFVHGTRDTFGSIDEMKSALKLLEVRHELLAIADGSHGLVTARSSTGAANDLAAKVAAAFSRFVDVG